MFKEDLEFPGEPVVRVKDPSALEFPEVPRVQTGVAKHDLRFPEGEESRESKSPQSTQAALEAKSAKSTQVATKVKEAQEPYALTPTHSEAQTLAGSPEELEEREESGSCGYASPRPGRVFARPLTAVAAVALAGLALAAVRPSAGRLRAVPVAVPLAVGAVVACGARCAR